MKRATGWSGLTSAGITLAIALAAMTSTVVDVAANYYYTARIVKTEVGLEPIPGEGPA